MADSDPPELAAALLKWVQAFQTSRTVNDFDDLKDGRVLWEILHDVDPVYFEDDLPESEAQCKEQWIPRWQNLKHVSRLLDAYLRDSSDVLDNAAGSQTPDLKAIATDASPKETVKLLKTMLRAAMYSPESNSRMGRIIVGLGQEAAMSIAAAMKQMEDADQGAPKAIGGTDQKATTGTSTPVEHRAESGSRHDSTSATETSTVGRDPELEQEEKLIHALKTIKQLQDNNAKVASDLEELRHDKDELQQAFDAFKYEVENEGRKAAEHDALKELQSKAERDKDYVAGLEAELETVKDTSETQQRQLERYKADAEAKQKLRDDNQLLRAEKDDLLQKSRMTENLKKKIQGLQDQEKMNITLKGDLRVANEQLQGLQQIREQCFALQKANTENMKTIANGEQEIFDQKTTRKRMEHEYKMLLQKWEIAKERQIRDHETIVELESRLQPDVNGESGGLEDEIAASEMDKPRPISTETSTISADMTLLQQRLDAISLRNTKLETEYLDLLQDKLGLETAIETLRDPSHQPEENVPFLEQRKKLRVCEAETAELLKQHFSTTEELASAKERLLATDGEHKSLDRDTEYQTLTAQYADLRKHAEGVAAELAEHRSLLRHALLNAQALSAEPADIRASNEYKLTLQSIQAVRDTPVDNDLLEHTATSLTDKIESARLESAAAAKRATDLTSDLAAMTSKLAAATSASEAKASSISNDAYVNLQRENRLMTTAWFDLSSRVQSNSVMLGRRKESPKGFLAKQRVIVTPTVAQGQLRR